METAILCGVLLVLFVITWIVIACNAPSIPMQPLPEKEWLRNKPFSEVMLEDQLKRERRENEMLKSELEYVKRSCRSHHQPPFLGCDGCHTVTRYYAQTIEEQRIADMLAKAKTTATQLVKDLTA